MEAVWLAVVVLLLLGTFVIGRVMERNHVRGLDERERSFTSLAVTNAKVAPSGLDAAGAQLCTGSVVIGVDYYRRFAALLKNIIGGRLGLVDRILRRGRREAVARMLEDARRQGADVVLNVRIETATIGRGQGDRGFVAAEFVAYGTAVRRRG